VVLQVHQHEGEVMQDIDTGNLVAELDAVEQGRPPFEQADVRQSHIAMAAPHASIAAPPVQLCRQLIEQGQLVPVERLHRISIEQCALAAQLLMIGLDGSAYASAATKGGRSLGTGMKTSDLDAQGLHQRGRQLAGQGHVIEQCGLRKAAHHHDPIQHLAVRVEGQHASAIPGDRAHPEVKARCRAPVQPQLGMAGALALFQREKIQRRIGDLALELVDAFATQKDQRAMGLDTLDRTARAAVAVSAGKKADDLVLTAHLSLRILSAR